jgi:hypothetical protein
MQAIQTHNQLAKEYQQFVANSSSFSDKESEYLVLTESLKEIRLRQIGCINNANIMESLSIDERNLICVDGVALKQWSSSQKIKFAVVLAIKSNPKFKVVRIENASLFDAENRRLLKEEVARLGYFLIEEVVGDAEIIMKNGIMEEKE